MSITNKNKTRFRFHPTDEELINDYLKKKVSSASNPELSIIANLNIYKFNPWELPGKALLGESEWFFFSPRDRKYPNGARPNRTAASGYWKATGTDKPILSSNKSQCVGVKKALVFYEGRAPKGIKTDWTMLEYRLLDDTHQLHKLMGSMRLDDWVLCRVRQRSKTLKQREEAYDSSCGSSPVFSLGCLQGQETTKMNTTLGDYDDYDFEDCLNNPIQIDDQDGLVDQFQEGSPGNSFSAVSSDTQPSTDFSLKEALESIKKVLSIGAFEELVPPVPPQKRMHASTSNNTENASIFQIASPPVSPSFP